MSNIVPKLISNARMGFARLAESSIRSLKGKRETETLGALHKILSSTIGRASATWNESIEVIVEMHSAKKDKTITVKPTVSNTLISIYSKDDIKDLYRGVTRIGLGI
jgi:hypothetical protein